MPKTQQQVDATRAELERRMIARAAEFPEKQRGEICMALTERIRQVEEALVEFPEGAPYARVRESFVSSLELCKLLEEAFS